VEKLLIEKKPKLLIAACSIEAARYAVMNWHYSKAMPSGKLVKFGVWEEGLFIGSIIYGRGANYNLSKILGYTSEQVCKLVRVALRNHKTPVTRMIAITIKELKRLNQDLKVIFSYADKDQGHKGTIYKAGNWTAIGGCKDESYYLLGKKVHSRSVTAKYGTRSIRWLRENIDPNIKKLFTKGKIRYVYPLTDDARLHIKHKK